MSKNPQGDVVPLGKIATKKPFRIFGFVIRCNHVWATYWRTIDEGTSEGVMKCKRCMKEKQS